MKRAEYDQMCEQRNTLKRQCKQYWNKFKEAHVEWKLKGEAFVDKSGRIQAYRQDGILYYGGSYEYMRKPIDLTLLDIPTVGRDVWYLIMRHLDCRTILGMETLCVRMAKNAAQIWKERGKKLGEIYGPAFNQILKKEKMTYQDFYHLCQRGVWCKEWLPFEVLFRLPVGFAKKYVGDGGPCAVMEYNKTFAVIENKDGTHSGYYKKKGQRTATFYFSTVRCKTGQNISAGYGSTLTGTVLAAIKVKAIPSPISSWDIYMKINFSGS